jgi:hypothetical protein
LENPTSADPNGEVEAANEEPLDVVNPFELTVTQGPMGVAPAFKFLVQIFYLSFLLFIPRLYFSRVERILKSAEMSMEDMEHMVVVGLGKWNRKVDRIPVYLHNSPMYPAFMQFSSSWDLFIRSLMKEWKTFNLVSVLLSTYVLRSSLDDENTDLRCSMSVPSSHYSKSVALLRIPLSGTPQ